MTNEERLVDQIIKKISGEKYKFINLNEVSEILRGIIGEAFTSEIAIAVKAELKEHAQLDFFREGTYICESKYHHCSDNWLAIKGIYETPVHAKFKRGWYAWQVTEEIDWNEMD